jgi:hypothetical protein
MPPNVAVGVGKLKPLRFDFAHSMVYHTAGFG